MERKSQKTQVCPLATALQLLYTLSMEALKSTSIKIKGSFELENEISLLHVHMYKYLTKEELKVWTNTFTYFQEYSALFQDLL